MEELLKNAENVSRTIQLILAPAVIISACAIIVGGLVSRTAAINDRIRAMNRERLELLGQGAVSSLAKERLQEIDQQLPDLLRRLQLSHHAVMATYGAILVLIGDMLVIAVATLTSSVIAGWLALLVFLSGAALLGLAVVLTIRELQKSLTSIKYEVERVSSLMQETEDSVKSAAIERSTPL